MPLLADYQLEHGLSDEQLADILNERVKRRRDQKPISAAGVENMRYKKDENVPPKWLEALDIEPPQREFIRESSSLRDEVPSPAIGEGDARGGTGTASLPVLLELPFDGLEAKKRIELVYVGVGRGVASAMHNPQIAVIFSQHAPKLAEKWIAAARQNARIAQVVTYVTAGGAVGDLIIAHITLVLSLLIVSGKVPIGGIGSLLGPDVVVPHQNGRQSAPPPAHPRGDGSEDAGAVRADTGDG